jgi:Lar family restriction alleviation protein
MKNRELKPCPFCGGKACIRFCRHTYTIPTYAVETGEEEYWVVRCEKCSIQYPAWGHPKTEQEAIEIWNRRADDGT